VDLETSKGDPARARQHIDKALAAHPDDSRYFILAARVAAASKDTKRVEALTQKILAADPGHEPAALLAAEAAAAEGRRDDARRLLELALTKKPGSVGLLTSLGMLFEAMGQPAEARTRYEAVIASAGQVLPAALRLATLYANDGTNIDMALQLASAAKRQQPDNPAITDLMGWVYVRKRLPTQALPYLQDAVRAEPNNPLFRYHLGVAFERRGEIARAREELSKALSISGAFAGADDARALLKTIGG
jgi:predicted Zn-dependent protease